jgi:hypothetical protein
MRLNALAHSLAKAPFQLDFPNEQNRTLYKTFTVSVTSYFKRCESDRKTEGKQSSILKAMGFRAENRTQYHLQLQPEWTTVHGHNMDCRM